MTFLALLVGCTLLAALASRAGAVFPANLHVALTGVNADGLPSAPWYVWSRLPLQAVFIGWVLAATRGSASGAREGLARSVRLARSVDECTAG